MSGSFDAIVIGGDANGLTAAAYLAKAGLKTILLDSREAIVGIGEPVLHALDPRVVTDLKLGRLGLTFAFRDLALVTQRAGNAPLTVPRDSRHAARGVASLSLADAEALPRYRQSLFALGRALRLAWWDGHPLEETIAALPSAQRVLAERLAVTSAVAFTSSWFETDALRAALAFDAVRAGFAPTEAGSALALAWSASQEMSGMQGASGLPRGGQSGLVQALALAAHNAGATIRTLATAHALVVTRGRIAGVELAAGECLEAPIVLSTLSRSRTMAMVPSGTLGLGAAQRVTPQEFDSVSLVFGLNSPPDLGASLNQPGSRHIVAERPEVYAAALLAARLGKLPDNPVLELVLPPPEPGPRASRVPLYVRAWPIPPAAFADRNGIAQVVAAAIGRIVPGFASRILSCGVRLPHEDEPASTPRLMASAASRIETTLPGLLLCGTSAGPVDAISGRAARQAARMAINRHQGKESR